MLDAMTRRYGEGRTLAEVGTEFGVSRERVAELLDEAEVPRRSRAEQLVLARARGATLAREAVARFREVGRLEAVSDDLGLASGTVRRLLRSFPGTLSRYRRPRQRKALQRRRAPGLPRRGARATGGPPPPRDTRPWPPAARSPTGARGRAARRSRSASAAGAPLAGAPGLVASPAVPHLGGGTATRVSRPCSVSPGGSGARPRPRSTPPPRAPAAASCRPSRRSEGTSGPGATCWWPRASSQ